MASYNVPLHPQRTLMLCWEACGKMMWQWKHKNLNGYARAGGSYLRMNRGLRDPAMDKFYKQLGLRSLSRAKGANVRHALKWTPVIYTEVGGAAGHALIAIGYDGTNYEIVNPAAKQVITFGDDGVGATGSATAGVTKLPRERVDKSLGNMIWYW